MAECLAGSLNQILRFKRKNSFKQFLALLVVFRLICPGALSARKEKHGAWLKVTRQDAQMIE